MALNCGECLSHRVKVVTLVDGVCPVCKADYRGEMMMSLKNKGRGKDNKAIQSRESKPKDRNTPRYLESVAEVVEEALSRTAMSKESVELDVRTAFEFVEHARQLRLHAKALRKLKQW